MAYSDFLPFATNSGANVVPQSAFASDPFTGSGYASGLVRSDKVNKLWRQSSFVAASVALLISQQLDIDVLDNGDLTGFTANLTQSIAKIATSVGGGGGGGSGGGGIPEAPVDSNIYGRGNLTWTAVLPLTGGVLTGALSIRSAVAAAPLFNVSRNTVVAQAPPIDTIARFVAADNAVARVVLDAFGQNSNLTLRRANGTAAVPTAVNSNDSLGLVAAWGYGATGYSSSARASIEFLALETWSDTNQGTMIQLKVTPTGGSSAPIVAMTITPSGVTLANPLPVQSGGTGTSNLPINPASWSLTGTILLAQGVNPIIPASSNTLGTIGTWNNYQMACISVGPDEAGIDFGRAHGTLSNPTALRNNDYLGSIWFDGYGATKWNDLSRAQISAYAIENWTDTAQGTTLVFSATSAGTTTLRARLFLGGTANYHLNTTHTFQSLTGTPNFAIINSSGIYTDFGLTVQGNAGFGVNSVVSLNSGRLNIYGNNSPGIMLANNGGGGPYGIWNTNYNLQFGIALSDGTPDPYQQFAKMDGNGNWLFTPKAGYALRMHSPNIDSHSAMVYEVEGAGNRSWTVGMGGNSGWGGPGNFFFFANGTGGGWRFIVTPSAVVVPDGTHFQVICAAGTGTSYLDIFDDNNSHIESTTQLWVNQNTGKPTEFGTGQVAFNGKVITRYAGGPWPLNVTTPAGIGAQVLYNVYGDTVWSCGARTDGMWGVGDESRAVFRFAIDIYGNTYNGTGSWAVLSDGRFKKDIIDYPRGLEDICKLHTVFYKLDGPAGTMMAEDGITRIGLIAAEAEEVMPELVGETFTDQLGTVKTIQNGPIIYALVNAVRELRDMVISLQNKG